MLGSHYRGPINYSDESLRQADAALERLYVALRGVPVVAIDDAARGPEARAHRQRFERVMDDDFNTPEAIAVLQAVARDLNVAKAAADGERVSALAAELRSLGAILGVLGHDAEAWLKTRPARSRAEDAIGDGGTGSTEPSGELAASEIDALVAARTAARKAKQFAESDRIRDALLARGVVLEDGAAGTSWRWR